jgi:hypothetical protein
VVAVVVVVVTMALYQTKRSKRISAVVVNINITNRNIQHCCDETTT